MRRQGPSLSSEQNPRPWMAFSIWWPWNRRKHVSLERTNWESSTHYLSGHEDISSWTLRRLLTPDTPIPPTHSTFTHSSESRRSRVQESPRSSSETHFHSDKSMGSSSDTLTHLPPFQYPKQVHFSSQEILSIWIQISLLHWTEEPSSSRIWKFSPLFENDRSCGGTLLEMSKIHLLHAPLTLPESPGEEKCVFDWPPFSSFLLNFWREMVRFPTDLKRKWVIARKFLREEGFMTWLCTLFYWQFT